MENPSLELLVTDDNTTRDGNVVTTSIFAERLEISG